MDKLLFAFLFQKDTLMHEAGHVLGLMHTHIRDDRDYHLIVNTTGVPEAIVHNMIKRNNTLNPYPYDLQSIMHYRVRTIVIMHC